MKAIIENITYIDYFISIKNLYLIFPMNYNKKTCHSFELHFWLKLDKSNSFNDEQ